jgi:hypothetical protein
MRRWAESTPCSFHALLPEHPHACRWKGRAPIGPLGEHIATTANADRASSICLEACIGANATTFLVFDKADVQAMHVAAVL